MTTKIKNSLDEYENEGGDLYWTPKQRAVLDAIRENPEASKSEIADIVAQKMAERGEKKSCHQSYVNYVLNNASPQKIKDLRRDIETGGDPLDTFGDEGFPGDETTKTTERASSVELSANQSLKPVTPDGEIADNTEVKEVAVDGDEATLTVEQTIPVEMTVTVPASTLSGELPAKTTEDDETDNENGEQDELAAS